MPEKYEQVSILSAEKGPGRDCFWCHFFAELKTPFERSDGAVIYGYCFQAGDRDCSPGMGKGYAVFVPEGSCKKFKRRKHGKEGCP